MGGRQATKHESNSSERYFIVRVMKTGSSTLIEQVKENFHPHEVFPAGGIDVHAHDVRGAMSIPYLLGLPSQRREEIRVYIGHFPYIAYEMLGVPCTTVTLLRDPVARTISHLKHAKRHQPRLRELPIEAVYEDPFVFGSLVHNYQAKYFAMTESDPLDGVMDVIAIDECRLAIAKANLDRIDVLGLTERYDDFLADLRARFGWSVRSDVAKNVSTEPWNVSNALRRRIEDDNAVDVEFYEYARALHATRQGRIR